MCSQKSSLRPCAGACAPQTCAKSGCPADTGDRLAQRCRRTAPWDHKQNGCTPSHQSCLDTRRKRSASPSRDRPLDCARFHACAKAGRTLSVCLCVPVPTSKRNNCLEQAETDDCVTRVVNLRELARVEDAIHEHACLCALCGRVYTCV